MRGAFLLLTLTLFLFLPACRLEYQDEPRSLIDGPAMVVSVSSDGRYAVSSHQDNRIVLWNVDSEKKTVISESANIYSAYFVRDANLFLWQDLEDIVHLERVDGEEVKAFKHFPTYGHVLSSDLKNYVSCDANWTLYVGHGEAMEPIKNDGKSPSFAGQGKLLNLTLSDSGNALLSAGRGARGRDEKSIDEYLSVQPEQIFSNYAGVVLWDLSLGKPLYKFPGNASKTSATMSPDGQYVVSGCENGLGYVWRTKPEKELLHRLASLYHGLLNKNGTDDYEKWTYDNTGLISAPADLNSRQTAVHALKFVDQQHYLRFLTYSPYAVLYHIDNPLPLKYLYLGRDPFPAVNNYSRNAAIDTAPEVGILVMGQDNGSGIIVYRYDSEKQELEKIWVADAPEPRE